MQLASSEREFDERLRNAFARQPRTVHPRRAQIDHFEAVQITIAAPELLDRSFADAIRQDRIERMRLVDAIGAKGSVRFLRAEVDAAADAAEAHRLEHIQ